jgi:HPt (histidine-containing phosphotransfer) domain-containing protein
MTADSIKKFASDACQVIEACQNFIGELAAENEQLRSSLNKKASAPAAPAAVELDADMLQKAASAVHALYGSPANVSVDTLADAWKARPSLMLAAINKFASELATRSVVSGANLGESVSKKASAPVAQNADDVLRSKYSF